MNKYKIILITILVILCSACAAHKERNKQVFSKVSQSASVVTVGIERLKNGDSITEANAESYIVNEFWVDPTPIITEKKEINSYLQRRLSLVTSIDISIEKLAQDLSVAAGINFTLAPEVIHGLRLTEVIHKEAAVEVGDDDNQQSQSKTTELPFITKLRARWVDEKVQNILNQLVSELNISWEYNENTNTVNLYKYKTKTYDAHLPGEAIKFSTKMSNESLVSGGGSVSVSGSAISTDMSINTDSWLGLTSRLNIIKSEGGRFITDKANFKVTLIDTDEVHNLFRKELNKLEKEALQQILFDITMLTVTGEESDLFGINFESVYNNSLLGSLTTGRPVDTALSLLSVGVERTTQNHTTKATVFAEALSKYGKVSISQSYQRSTLNNQIASIMQVRNRPYLRNVSIPVAGSDFNQNGEASLTDLVTGFSLSLRPHMVSSDEVLTTLSMNRRSAPNNFEQVDAGAGIILERPDIQDDSEIHQFIIGNNQTKIISGSAVETTQGDKSGSIDREIQWLGGETSNSKERRMILFFITARVI